MAKEGWISIRGDDNYKALLEAFIKEADVPKTLAGFLGMYLIPMMMAIDPDTFQKVYSEKNGTIIDRMNVMSKILNVMKFYNESKNAFLTNKGFIGVDELIQIGFRIDGSSLIING